MQSSASPFERPLLQESCKRCLPFPPDEKANRQSLLCLTGPHYLHNHCNGPLGKPAQPAASDAASFADACITRSLGLQRADQVFNLSGPTTRELLASTLGLAIGRRTNCFQIQNLPLEIGKFPSCFAWPLVCRPPVKPTPRIAN